MAKILLDGQAILVPDEVAQTDDGLIRALTPLYPDVANAEIARTTENGETVITVVKRPGPKGGTPADDAVESRTNQSSLQTIAALVAAPCAVNPAVSLCLELRRIHLEHATPETLLALRDRIDQATEAGEEQVRLIRASLKMLNDAAPIPSHHIPIGF